MWAPAASFLPYKGRMRLPLGQSAVGGHRSRNPCGLCARWEERSPRGRREMRNGSERELAARSRGLQHRPPTAIRGWDVSHWETDLTVV